MNTVLAAAGAALVIAAAWAGQPTLPARPLTAQPLTAGSVGTRRRWPGRPTLRAAAALAVAFFVGGPALAGAAFAGMLAWPRVGAIRGERRRRRQVAAELPDAIDIFVLAVGSGLTPRHAIEQLAQRAPPSVRPAFAAVVARLARGEVLADALRALDMQLGPPATALSTLVASADRRGLPLAAVLERLAAESRATRRRLDEAAARALPVKLSFPLVVCTLPSFVLLAIVPAVLAALSSLGADAW